MAKTPVNTGDEENRTASDSSTEERPILKNKSDEFVKRLNEVVGDENASAFSRRAGFRESVLRGYLSNGKRPGMDYLVAIADAGGVSVDWLATGRLPKTRSSLVGGHMAQATPSPAPMASELRSGYVAIPHYTNARVSAGGGVLNTEVEQADDALIFQEDWIRHELGARPQDLRLIRVHGDSMEPTLRAGDFVLVDGHAALPDREGIYILLTGEALLVKRLQLLPGRKIRVISDNTAFESWTIDPEDRTCSDVSIVGRVVWWGRRM